MNLHQLSDRIAEASPLIEAVPRSIVYAAVMLAVAGALLLFFFAPVAGGLSWVERRIAARIQSRIGPNRVGPQGFFQWIADGIKLFLKEDLMPAEADKTLFRLAPYPVFVGVFSTLVVIPFSSKLIVANLNVGLVYLLAITSFVVVGLIMSGWASKSKWTLLGGMRSAAQIVSYEVPAALSLLCVVLVAGSLATQDVVRAQGWHPLRWFVLHNPFLFVAFWIYFLSATAEGNRTPFDIPEAESELVSGYNTEYSGMRFVFFFFAEWANLFVIGAVASLAFLGGWQVPRIFGDGVLANLAQLAVFLGKGFFWVFVLIWMRWTLPRLRVDQLMTVSWKYLVPLSLVNVIGTAAWLVVFRGRGIWELVTSAV